jgi:glycosyltransferase involved in cell wall biosynthesis
VPNHVDLNTATYCHAAFHEATADARIPGSSFGWQIGERVALALERWWFARRVRVLVGLSEGSGADLRRLYPDVEVAVVPRGIDLERFRPDEGARKRLREDRGVSADDVVALFVDQDHRPLKGLELAIEGFAKASRLGDGPTLLWVLGERNERCRPLAASLGVGERVRFLGRTSDPERVYQAADVFVLPSAYESFSRSAHEAAACGLPILAPPLNGVSELIGADEAGIVVRRDAEEIGRGLARLAADPALRARMGSVGRQRAAAFARESVAGRLGALHDALLAGVPAG